MTRPPGLLDPAVLASRRWRTTPFPAVNLHASARGLATFYGALMDGEVEALLGRDLHREYVGAQVTGHDQLLDREVTWTLGFQVDDDEIGMGGAGGCSGWWSFNGGYAAAFVSRGLGSHDRDEQVYDLLEGR
jgi:CubicO group peptidase (beta-lactamase class C family)